MQVVGLDLGRRNIKLYTGSKYISFPAVVGEAREMRLLNNFGVKAFKGVYTGVEFFAGVLAENESEFARQMLVENKATEDALLLALIALHQSGLTEFDIVTGLPVNTHTQENKDALTHLLLGNHEITVNGVTKKLNIHRVRVAVEGGGAFWSNPKDGLVRIVDGGSKTINYITLNNRKYVDKDSGTLPFGFDTNKSADYTQMTNRIAGELGKKWSENDDVYTVGGEASFLAETLKPYFPKISALQGKKSVISGGEVIDFNLFANAIGYYNIGRSV